MGKNKYDVDPRKGIHDHGDRPTHKSKNIKEDYLKKLNSELVSGDRDEEHHIDPHSLDEIDVSDTLINNMQTDKVKRSMGKSQEMNNLFIQEEQNRARSLSPAGNLHKRVQNQQRSPTRENNIPRPPNLPNASKPSSNEAKADQIASELTYQILAIIVVVASILALYVVALYGYKIYLSDEKIRKCPVNKLTKKYPLEDNYLWTTLKIGIEDIINLESPEGPSVYLFLRNKNSKAVHFVEDIANLSASCFDPKLEPITLKSNDFNSDDYGIAIAKYKQNIHDGGVLIVLAHLNEVPGKAARALHSICDKYSPIVKKVIIFLSLVIDSDSQGRPVEIAEATLRKLWKSSLNENELDPLIVRVSDTVFRLNS